jgi:phosphoserine phosphatase
MDMKVDSAAALTAGQLERAVLDAGAGTAVFDCDGTLWSADAGYGFMVWSLNEGLVSRNASDWIDSRYRLYRASLVDEVTMCGEMVQLYAGLRENEIRAAAARYFPVHIAPTIFPEMKRLVESLHARGV